MDEVSLGSPGGMGDRCAARTRRGIPCTAPPLKSKLGSGAAPFCVFHSDDPEILAKRMGLRSLGSRGDRATPVTDKLPELIFDTAEDLYAYRTSILRLLLRREIEPQVARVAVEIATLVQGEKAKQTDAASFEAFSKSLAETFAHELSIEGEESGAQEANS